MALDLQGLSVFVASPGGLEAERKIFFNALSEFNISDGHSAGVSFIPRGHELAFAGAGRAQELINEQVRESDYLIVVFWDKWGRPPSDTNGYTSGTEEEFAVALECLENANMPMLDVVVFFKGVSDRQMSDPGAELQKVLDFQKKLEAERRVLYRTFDSPEEFKDELRRLLGKWARDWNSGEASKARLPPARTVEKIEQASEGSILEQAKLAARSGQQTVAHQLYTQATTGPYNREAWTEYVRFLRRSGRLGHLQTAADKMIEKARDLGDHEGAAEGLSNIGIAKRAQGQRNAAINYFDRALKEVDAWEAGEPTEETQSTRAFILDNMGLTWRRMPARMDDALRAMGDAFELHKQVDNERGQAHALRNIGIVQTQLGLLDESRESLTRAEALFREVQDERGLAMTLSSIGEVLELDDELPEAIEKFELALELNIDLQNTQGKSMNLSQLSRAFVAMGNIDRARDNAQQCLEVTQGSGSLEGEAAALHAMGRVHRASGEFQRAEEVLEDALELFRQVDQPAGIAGTAIELAQVGLAQGRRDRAREYLSVGQSALSGSPHYGLEQEARRIDALLNEGTDV